MILVLMDAVIVMLCSIETREKLASPDYLSQGGGLFF
jgi:hypothetical protein